MKFRLLFLLGLVIQAWAIEQTTLLSDDIESMNLTDDPSLQFDASQQFSEEKPLGISQIELIDVTHVLNSEGQQSLTIYAPHKGNKKKHETNEQSSLNIQEQVPSIQPQQSIETKPEIEIRDQNSINVPQGQQVPQVGSNQQMQINPIDPTVQQSEQQNVQDPNLQTTSDSTVQPSVQQVSSDPSLTPDHVVNVQHEETIQVIEEAKPVSQDPTLVVDEVKSQTQTEINQQPNLVPHISINDNGETTVIYGGDPSLQYTSVQQEQNQITQVEDKSDIKNTNQEVQSELIPTENKEVNQQVQEQVQQEVIPDDKQTQQKQVIDPSLQLQESDNKQYKQIIDPSLQFQEPQNQEQVQQIEVALSRLQDTLESAKEEKERQAQITPEQLQEQKIEKQMEKEQEELRQKIALEKEDEERRKQVELEEQIRKEAEIQQQLEKEEQIKMAKALKRAEEQKMKEAIQKETEEAIMKDLINQKEKQLSQNIAEQKQEYLLNQNIQDDQKNTEDSVQLAKEQAQKEFDQKKDEILAILHQQKIKENLLKDINESNHERKEHHNQESEYNSDSQRHSEESHTYEKHLEQKNFEENHLNEEKLNQPIKEVKQQVKEVEPFEKLQFEQVIEIEENQEDEIFQKQEEKPYVDQSEKQIFEEKVNNETPLKYDQSLDEILEQERLEMKKNIEEEERLESVIQQSQNDFMNEAKKDFPENQFNMIEQKKTSTFEDNLNEETFWQQQNKKQEKFHPSDVIAEKLTQYKNKNIQKEDYMMFQELIDKNQSETKMEQSEQEVIEHLKEQRQKKMLKEQEKALKAKKEEEALLKQQLFNPSNNDQVIEELLDNVYQKKNQETSWEPPNKKLIEREIKEFLKSQQIDLPDFDNKTKNEIEEQQIVIEMTEEQKKKIFEQYLEEKKRRKEEIFKQLKEKYNQKDTHIAEVQTKEKQTDTSDILNYEFELAYQDWYQKNQPKIISFVEIQNNLKDISEEEEKEYAQINRLRGQMNHYTKK